MARAGRAYHRGSLDRSMHAFTSSGWTGVFRSSAIQLSMPQFDGMIGVT